MKHGKINEYICNFPELYIQYTILYTGTIEANFHLWGRIPISNDLLKITENEYEISSAHSLSNYEGIPSGPHASLGSREPKIVATYCYIVISGISGHEKMHLLSKS